MAASSNAEKNPFDGKREANAVYGQKGRNKEDYHQSVGAVLVSNSARVKWPQQRGN